MKNLNNNVSKWSIKDFEQRLNGVISISADGLDFESLEWIKEEFPPEETIYCSMVNYNESNKQFLVNTKDLNVAYYEPLGTLVFFEEGIKEDSDGLYYEVES